MQFKITVCWLFAGFALSAVAAPSLDQKLNQQWLKYQQAQDTLLMRSSRLDLPLQQRMIARPEWESLLRLTGQWALNAGDLRELRARHEKKTAEAKVEAVKNSVISLDEVRAKKESAEFCRSVPKGGMLHVHPFGTVDHATAESLIKRNDPMVDSKNILTHLDSTNGNWTLFPDERKWLEGITPPKRFYELSSPDQVQLRSMLFLPPGKQPFPRFNAVFEFLTLIIPDVDSLAEVILNFARKAVSEGVIYAEFTSSPRRDVFQAIERIERETGIRINVNQGFFRTLDAATLEESFYRLLTQTSDPNLTGIDFIDNEETNPALEKGQLLYTAALRAKLAGQTNLRRTMHAGEIGDPRNARDAMILGAERLGHAVLLEADPVALEYAARSHQPVEVNIVSNLRLSSVQNVASHPFLKYHRLGLKVSLSTDDEGIFETDINHECELAVSETDIQYVEFKQMAFNSIETSFASAVEKEELLKRLRAQFVKFEAARAGQ